MAEQFIKAYAVSFDALGRVVGANIAPLLARMKAHDSWAEIDELISDIGEDASECLEDISSGKLKPKRAQAYRRALELVAAVVGKPLETEVDMPGRGWHELGSALPGWGLPILGGVWGGVASGNEGFAWPWNEPTATADWPVAAMVANSDLAALAAEARAFSPSIVAEVGVPSDIARFGDPSHWPPAEIGEVFGEVCGTIATFADQAARAGLDLLLWHDGQQ